MEQRCTCGAVLPEDARFCHKCGKPQWEEDVAAIDAQEAAAAPAEPALPSPSAARPASGISFRNSRAVLVSLFVAGGALLGLMAVGFVIPALAPVLLCGAGFLAVRLYRRQSAEPLSPAAGARLGWMTGLWLFLVVAILCAFSALVVANPDAWEKVKAAGSQLPQASELLKLSQHDFIMQQVISLPFYFLFLTLLPLLGGMLGAKMPAGRRPS